tara:strand:+ start:2929 stop:4434 length:1506 start_codon:yes stop_codon:yes gene_type:complete
LVKANLIANFSGGLWSAIISLLFVPLFIKILGIESYGLIGVYGSLVGIFGILDMGLSSTLNRKIAKSFSFEDKITELKDFVRTIEIIFWLIGIFLCTALFLFSDLIANHWLNFDQISPLIVQKSIALMGLIIAFEWPMRCYYGGLRGLQKQLLLNIIKIFFVTLQNLGALLLLLFYSSDIQTFFVCQVIVSSLHTFTVAIFLWMSIPKNNSKNFPKFDYDLLKSELSFTKGLFGISLISLLMSQSDKIILSKMLDLKIFAYYILAINITQFIFVLSGPFYTTLFPRFCELISIKKEKLISELYHKGSQFLSVLIFPVVMTLVFFTKDIILIWSGDPDLAINIDWLIKVSCIGFTINGIMQIPYALQLSYGWTKLPFLVDLFSLFIFIPLITISILHLGALGAMIARASTYFVGFILTIYFMHKKLLISERYNWVIYDIMAPLLISFIVTFSIKNLFYDFLISSGLKLFFIIFISYLMSLLMVITSTRHTKFFIVTFLKNIK